MRGPAASVERAPRAPDRQRASHTQTMPPLFGRLFSGLKISTQQPLQPPVPTYHLSVSPSSPTPPLRFPLVGLSIARSRTAVSSKRRASARRAGCRSTLTRSTPLPLAAEHPRGGIGAKTEGQNRLPRSSLSFSAASERGGERTEPHSLAHASNCRSCFTHPPAPLHAHSRPHPTTPLGIRVTRYLAVSPPARAMVGQSCASVLAQFAR